MQIAERWFSSLLHSAFCILHSEFCILIADGLRPDTLDAAIRDGDVPELAALRHAYGSHVVTTAFPSVTGVAYIPMLTGRHPAEVGVPGLRWFDRTRHLPAIYGHSRSYVGAQLRRINDDLSPAARTAYELTPGRSLGCGAMVTRGLPARAQLDRGLRHVTRVIRAHVTGDVEAWASLEVELAERLVDRVRREQPAFVLAAFTAGDKAAHAAGHDAPGVRRSLRLVDHVAASIRRDAEKDGRWSGMQLWVVSDHGHSPVEHHFDLAGALRERGVKVRSHPWTFPDRSEAAVMVSGNSMAHVYLGLQDTSRRMWGELAPSWMPRLEWLWPHPAIDLIACRRGPSTVQVYRRAESAEITADQGGISYCPTNGNPLGIGAFFRASDEEAHERSAGSAYPDGVVQLARLVLSERAGDLVISASPGWDLRRRYEPINHVSSHGALHAAHMLVPLIGNRRVNGTRRTADLYRFVEQHLMFGNRYRSDADPQHATTGGARSDACVV